ncbi:MAG: hypothetical protein JO249_18635 [Acidobacteria bacterium]|nr:hypothetical protein [Acidobacteriota bacterium]
MTTHSLASGRAISGRRVGVSFLTSIVAAAIVGTISYYALQVTVANSLGPALPQLVTLGVYLTLLFVFCYFFRPAKPISHRPDLHRY